MSKELSCTRTHITPLDLFSALGEEVWRVIGEQPKRESVLCLLAQFSLETGGSAACWNFDLANIRHTDGDGRDWTTIPSCSEIENGKEVHYNATDHPEKCRFRAYESISPAVVDYVATLRKTFKTAWDAMLTGDPSAFAVALHNDHFYTASVSLYTKALVSWYARLDRGLPTA